MNEASSGLALGSRGIVYVIITGGGCTYRWMSLRLGHVVRRGEHSTCGEFQTYPSTHNSGYNWRGARCTLHADARADVLRCVCADAVR